MKTFNKIKRCSIITTQHLYCDKKKAKPKLDSHYYYSRRSIRDLFLLILTPLSMEPK